MPSWDKDDTNVKIDKIWTLYVEDPRNRIPAVDVFASGAQF